MGEWKVKAICFIPLVQRLKERFGVGEIVVVADRGMVSKEMIEELGVSIQEKRNIVRLNPEEAERDKAEREVIIEHLREKLKEGAKVLIGNRGYDEER